MTKYIIVDGYRITKEEALQVAYNLGLTLVKYNGGYSYE